MLHPVFNSVFNTLERALLVWYFYRIIAPNERLIRRALKRRLRTPDEYLSELLGEHPHRR